MTEPLFRTDAYCRDAAGTVTALTEAGGIILDQSIFYPTGGGQAGDSGWVDFGGQEIAIATTVKGEDGAIILVPAEGSALPEIGAGVTQRLDWDKRSRLMRMHTALHLMSVVVPFPVTGGQITVEKGRLDFDMAEPPEDKAAIEAEINALIAADHPVSDLSTSEDALRATPALVKTVSVMPPMGAGVVRLVRIGTEDAQIDLQACGGTHVRSTSEIGGVTLGKVEKKSRSNRRFNLFLKD